MRISDWSSDVCSSDLVRLPASAVLPDVQGMRGPLSCLNKARYGILFGAIGAARACYEAALDYSTSREQFGRPIGGFQLDRKSVVTGTSGFVRVDLGGRRIIKKKTTITHNPIST